MAGIAWGVASIVLIVAMGDGFKQGQRNNTKQLGENIVLLFPAAPRSRWADSAPAGGFASLTTTSTTYARNAIW
jgi:ABC-type antimicrobial peptide transport system permease subunit